jgi:hypothetical protein
MARKGTLEHYFTSVARPRDTPPAATAPRADGVSPTLEPPSV